MALLLSLEYRSGPMAATHAHVHQGVATAVALHFVERLHREHSTGAPDATARGDCLAFPIGFFRIAIWVIRYGVGLPANASVDWTIAISLTLRMSRDNSCLRQSPVIFDCYLRSPVARWRCEVLDVLRQKGEGDHDDPREDECCC